MTDARYIASWCMQALPQEMRSRMLRNPEFRESLGFKHLTPFEGVGSVWFYDLLDVTRKVYATGERQTMQDLNGEEIKVSLNCNQVAIAYVGDNPHSEIPPFELALLAPDAQVRLSAFGEVFHQYGVTGPKSLDWVPILESRPLSNQEISQIQNAIRCSVPNWQRLVQEKLFSNELEVSDLVPPIAEYFINLCGPLPGSMEINEYVHGPLADYRKTLVRENLFGGLLIMLPGFLRADMFPASVLSDFTTDEVWQATESLQDMPDPFTMLGLIEIALKFRSEKLEFDDLASGLIEKLCAEKMLRQDGLDVYELFPELVKISLRHLRGIDDMMLQPPFWHKLCAFTHAGLLIRLLEKIEFNLDEYQQWLMGEKHGGDTWPDLLALRSEPSWRFDYLTRDQTHAEIIGRIKLIEENENSKGIEIPHGERLKERAEVLLEKGISPFRPGPLEGHLRPKDNLPIQALPDDDVAELMHKLKKVPSELPWAVLGELSVSRYFPEELRKALSENLQTIELPGDDFSDRVGLLLSAGLVAAIHRDSFMANVIAERLFREFDKDGDVMLAFAILLIANAAIDDEWIDWLREKLHQLAHMSPKGESLKSLSILIDDLQSMLPTEHWKFSRVQALCGT